METHKDMPKEIASAIVSVMGKVERIYKDTRNEHGKYNYVSVDSFFEKVGKLMSEDGILLVLHEISSAVENRESIDNYGKPKLSAWLICEYDAWIYHSSGSAYGPIRRTIQVVASGPQAYGSAMSFVEKYFLRGLFKIPTGEQDADVDAQHGLPERSNVKKDHPKTTVKDEATTAFCSRLVNDFRACDTSDELRILWKDSERERERHGCVRGTPAYEELHSILTSIGHELTKKESGAMEYERASKGQ